MKQQQQQKKELRNNGDEVSWNSVNSHFLGDVFAAVIVFVA